MYSLFGGFWWFGVKVGRRSPIIFGQVSKLGNHGFGVEVRLFLGDLIQLGLGHGAKAELRPSVPFSEGLSGLVSK